MPQESVPVYKNIKAKISLASKFLNINFHFKLLFKNEYYRLICSSEEANLLEPNHTLKFIVHQNQK